MKMLCVNNWRRSADWNVLWPNKVSAVFKAHQSCCPLYLTQQWAPTIPYPLMSKCCEKSSRICLHQLYTQLQWFWVQLTRGPKCLQWEQICLFMYFNIRESVHSKKYIQDAGNNSMLWSSLCPPPADARNHLPGVSAVGGETEHSRDCARLWAGLPHLVPLGPHPPPPQGGGVHPTDVQPWRKVLCQTALDGELAGLVACTPHVQYTCMYVHTYVHM